MAGSAVVGVGTDVIEVARIQRALERPGFMARVYSESEIQYCLGTTEELSKLSIQRFAARFSAKEAVMKAMGVGLGATKFVEIETVSTDSGAPAIVLSGSAKDLAGKLGIGRWLVSLSHSDSVAQAFVAAVES